MGLASEEHLWSACGLPQWDRSAPYYRRDGYWNGAVWMPYQWMFFKAALDAGKTGFAFRIADTPCGCGRMNARRPTIASSIL